ncbi:MAG: lipocalin family protein [Candidatus Methylumidiphilus sp.]
MKTIASSKIKPYAALVLAAVLGGCAGSNTPLPTVAHVDLPRFMGDWYVIACIPTFIETEAFNAVESYRLAPDGTVATTFTFRQGGFDGPLKRYEPTGFVVDRVSNAVWGMQFLWPFKSEYRIAYLDEDYQQTVIARTARDYVWIMARTPSLGDAEYNRLTARVADLGYDVKRLRKVPQAEPAAQGR